MRVKKSEDGETRDVGSRSRAFAAHLRSLFFEHERPPRYLIVDNAFENRSEAVLAVCNEADVTVMPIDPYTPQQNAMVERCHRAIKDALRPIILHEHEALREKTRRAVVGDAVGRAAEQLWAAWQEKNPLRPRLEADYVFQDLLKRATMHVNCKPRAGLRNMSPFEFHKSAKPPTDRFLGAGFRRDASLAEVPAGDPVEVLVARAAADGHTETLTCRGVKEADGGVRITHVVKAGGVLEVPVEVRGGTIRHHNGLEYRIQHAWRRGVEEGLDEGTKKELEALRRGPERHAAYALVMEDLAEEEGAADIRRALKTKLRDTAPDQLQRQMEATVQKKSAYASLPQNVRRTLREVSEAFQADTAEEAPNMEEATRQRAVDGVKAAMDDAQRYRKMMDNFNSKMRGANQNMDVKGSFTAPVRRGDIVRRHRSVYDKAFKKQVKGNITNKKDFFSQFSDEIYTVARIVETTWNPAKFGKQIDQMKYEQERDSGRNATRFGYFLVPHGQEEGADELGPYARGEFLLVPRATLRLMVVDAPLPRAAAAPVEGRAAEEEEEESAVDEDEVAPFRKVLPDAAMPETRAELDALRGYVATYSAFSATPSTRRTNWSRPSCPPWGRRPRGRCGATRRRPGRTQQWRGGGVPRGRGGQDHAPWTDDDVRGPRRPLHRGRHPHREGWPGRAATAPGTSASRQTRTPSPTPRSRSCRTCGVSAQRRRRRPWKTSRRAPSSSTPTRCGRRVSRRGQCSSTPAHCTP